MDFVLKFVLTFGEWYCKNQVLISGPCHFIQCQNMIPLDYGWTLIFCLASFRGSEVWEFEIDIFRFEFWAPVQRLLST